MKRQITLGSPAQFNPKTPAASPPREGLSQGPAPAVYSGDTEASHDPSTWRLHADFPPNDGTDLLVFESPEPWGPFALAHCEEYWEGKALNPYCPRVPLKWMESDGVTGWLQFSGGWGHNQQVANLYRSHVRPFRLWMK